MLCTCYIFQPTLYITGGLKAKNLLRKSALWIGLPVKVFRGVQVKPIPEGQEGGVSPVNTRRKTDSGREKQEFTDQ